MKDHEVGKKSEVLARRKNPLPKLPKCLRGRLFCLPCLSVCVCQCCLKMEGCGAGKHQRPAQQSWHTVTNSFGKK